jgi:hypothetical protein
MIEFTISYKLKLLGQLVIKHGIRAKVLKTSLGEREFEHTYKEYLEY